MQFLIRETLSFNLMYVAACYPVGTTISKTSSHYTALLHVINILLVSSNRAEYLTRSVLALTKVVQYIITQSSCTD